MPAGAEGRKCYEVCQKFGKPVIAMEPVKGGNLVNLPERGGVPGFMKDFRPLDEREAVGAGGGGQGA